MYNSPPCHCFPTFNSSVFWYVLVTNFLHVAFVLHVVQFLEMAPPLRVPTTFKHRCFFTLHVVGSFAPLLEGLWALIDLDPTLAITKPRM